MTFLLAGLVGQSLAILLTAGLDRTVLKIWISPLVSNCHKGTPMDLIILDEVSGLGPAFQVEAGLDLQVLKRIPG